ncbi:MAG TPA: hypothetical protein DDW87_04850 [Firmicutes bacterium]|nr:hypothetical protein [Bacillota bacterium]
MRKYKRWALILSIVILGAALVQANPQSEFLDNGFQALLYHAIRLEETFPSVNPVGMAITEFEKAEREGIHSGEASLMMGLIYQYLDRPGTALGYYLKFAEQHPEEIWVHSFVGDMYAEMGRLDDAKSSYELAIAGASEEEIFAQAYVGLGNAALENGDYAQAKEAFEKALTNAGDYVDSRLGLGKAHFFLEEYAEAIEALEVAQVQAPRSATVSYYLALSYAAEGLDEQAEHAFARYDELQATN